MGKQSLKHRDKECVFKVSEKLNNVQSQIKVQSFYCLLFYVEKEV